MGPFREDLLADDDGSDIKRDSILAAVELIIDFKEEEEGPASLLLAERFLPTTFCNSAPRVTPIDSTGGERERVRVRDREIDRDFRWSFRCCDFLDVDDFDDVVLRGERLLDLVLCFLLFPEL